MYIVGLTFDMQIVGFFGAVDLKKEIWGKMAVDCCRFMTLGNNMAVDFSKAPP